MKVLVTGAAGRIGRAVCRELAAKGDYVVRGADVVPARDFPGEWMFTDLRDPLEVYRAVDSCEAVVHLGNYPHMLRGMQPQRLYAENVAMTANVFQAAQESGLSQIVFASSIQAVSGSRVAAEADKPSSHPYLPMDGHSPACAGNLYGQSKVAGEDLLRLFARQNPQLCCTAVRFPWVVTEEDLGWLKRRRGRGGGVHPRRQIDECLSYIWLDDAARLVEAILRRQTAGYHAYLPTGLGISVAGVTLAEVVEQYFRGVELRRPVEEMESLGDNRPITRDVGWEPLGPVLCDVIQEETEADEASVSV